ncbi:DUF2141 domain-containing protein [Mucilaginibacter sp. BJC16-A38]|uniref:DUF2141 domain-containing protein n=1 Tax=Mucilaginibacter phenanthrenivorans TaxID=1234842 RepID=UPI0021583F23|nr:DUF2141 domain-containing protein [Mucilaginibacter phenanthrenivorans]MCR8560891.1 DUF2141 domain-containing protein [Mucilaginibacter phenanthrenivorans]
MKKSALFAIKLIVGAALVFLSSYIRAQETQVKITGIRSAKGTIILNVFKDNETYNKQQPCKTFTFDKKSLDSGTLIVKCNLEPGTYGFTIVDDENGNGKIDKNLIGMPKEGFGFSNFFLEKMKRPVFDDFKVDLKLKPKIDIRVKYM